jgi:hypothetical protein
VDFSAILKPVRFGKERAPGDDVPRPYLHRQAGPRRFAQLREAAAILATLPAPGESLHCLQSGRYDLCDVVGVLIDKLGAVEHLAIATLSFHQRNVSALLSWIEAGQVKRLTMLCSLFFREHFPETYEALFQGIGDGPHRLAAARCHAKLVCLHFQDAKMVIEGSANLRTNSNVEQFTLFHDAPLCDWWGDWIESEVKKHAQVE